MDEEPELRWSHTSNSLGHPARPDPDTWHDTFYDEEASVCVECGYYCWLTSRWARWRS